MEEYKAVCTNPWCKATFRYKERDIKIEGDKKTPPSVCNKCVSFDRQLSSGIKWETREYEGNPWEGLAITKYKVNLYK